MADLRVNLCGMNLKNPIIMASGTFGFTCSTMVYKLRNEEEVEIPKIYKEIEKGFIAKLKK